MFTILLKKVIDANGKENTFERYFHDWKNAEKVMDDEVNDLIKGGAKVTYAIDRLNHMKGFYEYEKTLTREYEDGKYTYIYALIDAYFMDEDKTMNKQDKIKAIVNALENDIFDVCFDEVEMLEYEDKDGVVYLDRFDYIDTSTNPCSVYFIGGSDFDNFFVPIDRLTEKSVDVLYNCIG